MIVRVAAAVNHAAARIRIFPGRWGTSRQCDSSGFMGLPNGLGSAAVRSVGGSQM